MKLLLVTRAIYPLHGFGGMERHCHDWIHALSKLGCKIDVVTMPPVSSFDGFDQSVKFHFIPGRISRRILPRITSYPVWTHKVRSYLEMLLQKNRMDAIYAHGLAASGCTNLNVPVFYNPHGMEEFKTGGMKYLAYSSFRAMSINAASASTAVIATDKIMIPEIENFLKVPSSKIVVIPNAVILNDMESRCAGLVEKYQLNDADPVFLAAGRLEQNKGFHILIEAIARAETLPKSWKLIIAGEGSRSHTLKMLAKEKGVLDHMQFPGAIPQNELEALFRSAHLFIQPSLYEGSSIVTLEAMKNKLPVIASKTGGLPDKITNGKNGWLVEPGNSAKLAAAIDEAVSQRERWPAMGEHSLQLIKESFSWEKAAQKFVETFSHPEYFNIAPSSAGSAGSQI